MQEKIVIRDFMALSSWQEDLHVSCVKLFPLMVQVTKILVANYLSTEKKNTKSLLLYFSNLLGSFQEQRVFECNYLMR